CNLIEFPIFLRFQHELEALYLSNNDIHGQIPKWIFNMGKQTLLFLDLSNLPYEYFQCWNSMKVANLTYSKVGNLTYAVSMANPIYLIVLFTITSQNFVWYGYFIIMMGYGSGLVVGLVIGNNLNIRKLERVVENLRRRQ
ncbi:receptor-like protein 32, partial [Quercus suber]